MIAAEADVYNRNDWGNTALMWAASSGNHECVDLLLQTKADVYKQDILGCTALMLAANNGHHECVDLLITARADVKRQRDGLTALMHAA